jgi:hypothetical protein
MSESSWAVLRQVVIATTSLDNDVAAVRAAFGLGIGFQDPEVVKMHMLDTTIPISKDSFLEFIAPVDDRAGVYKWITKIGGRGGYVMSVQHPDPEGVKQRALARGIRVPIEERVSGYHLIQLHPQDVGVLLELDGIADPKAWFWDDINPGPEPDAVVSDIVGVEVPVADPSATAMQWNYLLDLTPGASTQEVQLGSAWVRFVAGGPSAD